MSSFSFETDRGIFSDLKTIANGHKLILIDFWSSNCIPCKENLPGIKKLNEQYRSQGFSVVSISTDKNKADWQKAILKENISAFYHGIDDSSESIQQKLGIIYTPTYILIDQNLKIVGKFNSRWKGQADLAAFVKEYFFEN